MAERRAFAERLLTRNTAAMSAPPCPLCHEVGGEILANGRLCRVVLCAEPEYPGFCRVILHEHVAEMTDLAPAARVQVMEVVFAVEECLRVVLAPVKVNLASLGNVVPHVHWHVIPRWMEDRCYPDPIWAAPRREGVVPVVSGLAERLREELGRRLPWMGVGRGG
jgi:diadenosine tetraphosphate (Ap4A) HIT family hydrolase